MTRGSATADRAVSMKYRDEGRGGQEWLRGDVYAEAFFGVNGSGMHVHQSLWNSTATANLFYADDQATGYLSDIARYSIGGQLAHGREMCGVLASWPNSYKRLVPGYEAPVYVAWALKTGPRS